MNQLSAESIGQQINTDINACEQLLELLQKEQTALKEREIDSLDEIIQAKAKLLAHLEKSAVERRNWAQLSNIEADSEQWQQLLEEFNHPALLENWQKLKALMQDCKEANEVNGKLLARSQEVFARISGILRGQNQNLKLYGASGRSTSSQISQKVGEA